MLKRIHNIGRKKKFFDICNRDRSYGSNNRIHNYLEYDLRCSKIISTTISIVNQNILSG